MPNPVRNRRIGIVDTSTQGGGNFILDKVSMQATGAYSLRRLSSQYYGKPAIVRRSTDNAESDIAFTRTGDFDTVAANAFIGAGNGFFSWLYDQSGRGFHFKPDTGAQEYQMVTSSALTTRTHMFSSATMGGYYNPNLKLYNGSFTALMVFRSDTADEAGLLQSVETPEYSYVAAFPNTGYFMYGPGNISNDQLQLLPLGTLNINHVLACWGDRNIERRIYSKGVKNNSTIQGTYNTLFTPKLGLGYHTFRGHWCEIIFFNRPIPASDVIRIQQDQMAYYGIS